MNKLVALTSGAGVGAALMYLLDPQQGRRRRKYLYDQGFHYTLRLEDGITMALRDTENRAHGLRAEARARLMQGEAPDDVLVERVRSSLGRFVSHPRAIDVVAEAGVVTLSGPILAHEVDRTLAAVRGVRGVKQVIDHLDVHTRSGGVPALQGGRPRPGAQFELRQANWSPATRLLTGVAGASMVAYGAARGRLVGRIAGLAGAGVLARALSNTELKHLLGLGERPAVEVHKTIQIGAPPDEVFAFWSHYDNLPRFMSHVRLVKDLGHGRSHWEVDGPAGVPIAWNAVVTRVQPGELLAWRSEPGAPIPNAGIVRFVPNADGSTRVEIRLTYRPPAGMLGHAAALLFGSDPKSRMDEDLVRFKSLIEAGKTTAHQKTVTRDEVAFSNTISPDPALQARERGGDERWSEEERDTGDDEERP